MGGVHRKQLQWEDKQNSQGWKARKANFQKRGKSRGKMNDRRGSGQQKRNGPGGAGGGGNKRKMNSNPGKFAKRKKMK